MVELKRVSLLVAVLAIALGVVYGFYSATAFGAQDSLTLRVDSSTVQGSAGCQATVSIIADGAANLAGLQFDLAFDPAVAQVVDDPATALLVEGIIRGDDLPGGYFLAGNVDNTTGVVSVAVAGSKAFGVASVMIADVTFDLIGAASSSTTLTFASTKAADDSAPPSEISVSSTTPGQINIQTGNGSFIRGTVKLQLRTPTTPWLSGVGFSSAAVRAEGLSGFSRTQPVDSDGGFEFCGAPDDTYTLTASAQGFLDAELTGVAVSAADVDVGETMLLTGDADSSGFVSIDDITAGIGAFGQGPPAIGDCMDAVGRLIDLDCSDFLSIDDITGTIGNFGLSSPQPW